MSSTSEFDEMGGVAWYWELLKLLAFLGAIFYGLRNIPPVVDGIPFLQVLPALFLGGAAILCVDLIRVLLDPGRFERAFFWAAGAIFVGCLWSIQHNVLHRLGLVERDASEHLNRLTQREGGER